MSKNIIIVSTGSANIGSVVNMLKKIGLNSIICKDNNDLKKANHFILPGVGSFDNAVKFLGNKIHIIKDRVLNEKIPILGICLGMQLLGTSSEEGKLNGLNLIGGKNIKFDLKELNGLKIPHMGWSKLRINKDYKLFAEIQSNERFYFVHSYHFKSDDPKNILAYANYGIEFVAAIKKKHICGVQFHPEKSHYYGMSFLRNYFNEFSG